MSADLFQTIRSPIYGQGQVIAYTGTAGTSSLIKPGANAVWVICTTAAYVKVGVGVTATTSDFPIPANAGMVFPIEADGSVVSAIQVAAGGNLHVCPLAR